MALITVDQIRVLQLEITSHCNAACPHCPRFNSLGELTVIPTHWNSDQVLKNLELDRMTALKAVILEGDNGDPLMHPDIEHIINTFVSHQNKPKVTLITNGSIRSATWWRNLIKADNLEVIFSIDGLQDTNHIYRQNLNFDKIISNARAFIESGGYAVWKFIIFKHNQHQIDEVKKLGKELGFARTTLALPIKSRFLGNDSYVIQKNGQEVGVLEYPTVNQMAYHKPINLSPVTFHVCPNLMKGHIYVTASGHILPCCGLNFKPESNSILTSLAEDFDSLNLSQNKLSNILEEKTFIKNLNDQLLTGYKMESCKSCESEMQFSRERHQSSL